jgi:hypothetical protein
MTEGACAARLCIRIALRRLIALRSWIPESAALVCVCIMAGIVLGCGAPAAPLPPTLNLPQPVHDLAATRAGNTVHLTFSVPQKTTDKLPVRGMMTASLCRSVQNGPCRPAVALAIPGQQKTFSMEDTLPPELTQGPPRLLTYRLSVLNRAGKSAGDSAPASTAAGAVPPAVAGFTATPQRKGIVVSWQGSDLPAGVAGWIRVDRIRTSTPPPQLETAETNHHSLTGTKPEQEPAEQVLRLSETADSHPTSAIDVTAHTGNSYRYVAQRIYDVTLDGRTIAIASQPSAPVETAYRDIFPPPVPVGLVSASDSSSRSIDLDWTPNVDHGLAGYIVYRRALGTSEIPERISPAGKPVTTSNWSDSTAAPGQRYAYSVSAIDLSGNESQRSTEVEDQWNAPSSQPNP